MREYEQPKMPGNWTSEAKNFYIGLVNVLDELHMPVQENWLSEGLKDRINSASSTASKTYSFDERDTGMVYVTGKNIYSVTQQIDLASATEMNSNEITDLGYIISFEGFAVTSSGRQYPVNSEGFKCWKAGTGNTFKLLASVACTAYVTVYYTKGDDTPVEAPTVLFDNGYVDGFAWEDNTPFVRTGETSYVACDFSHVVTDGYMHIYNSARDYHVSRYAYVAVPVTVPSSASKLHIIASGANKCPKLGAGLVTAGAANCQAYTGTYLPFTTLSFTQDDYSFAISDDVKGTEQYVVINFSGYSDARRDMRIYKVYFE